MRTHAFMCMPSRTEICVRVHITKALSDTLFTIPNTQKHARMHACAHADTNARVRTHRCVRIYMIESLTITTIFLQSVKQGPSFQSKWEATQQAFLNDMRTFDQPSCKKLRRRFERDDPALPLTKNNDTYRWFREIIEQSDERDVESPSPVADRGEASLSSSFFLAQSCWQTFPSMWRDSPCASLVMTGCLIHAERPPSFASLVMTGCVIHAERPSPCTSSLVAGFVFVTHSKRHLVMSPLSFCVSVTILAYSARRGFVRRRTTSIFLYIDSLRSGGGSSRGFRTDGARDSTEVRVESELHFHVQ